MPAVNDVGKPCAGDTSLLPTSLTSRPEPFHLALGPPWMRTTAQTPHRRAYRNIAVSLINGMSLPGKREPGKRMGFWIRHR